MDVRLPRELAQSVADYAAQHGVRDTNSRSATLSERSTAISDCYRGGGKSSAAIKGEPDIAAYAVTRMPATYAAIAAALEAVALRMPDFAPTSVLDVGAGLGSASWAAIEAWPAIESLALLDNHAGFQHAAEIFARASASSALQSARMLSGDIANFTATKSFDLVIAGYALAEISKAALSRALDNLWAACSGVLLIVEPGTSAGFDRILISRDRLLKNGARLIAPCPHENVCPIVAPDWCHFTQRLPRLKAHMRAKSAEVPFEDEKFSYLAAAKPGLALQQSAARVLAQSDVTKGEVRLKLCSDQGLERRVVPRGDKVCIPRFGQ